MPVYKCDRCGKEVNNVWVVILVTYDYVSCELITKHKEEAEILAKQLTDEENGIYAYASFYRNCTLNMKEIKGDA